jgi:hypothetical protein
LRLPDLVEATDLKIVAQSFGLGLSKYLFGEGAYLKEIDPSAWRGIQSRWPNSHKVVDSKGFQHVDVNFDPPSAEPDHGDPSP